MSRVRYVLAFALLLAIEASIALWAHDRFIRPFVGDVLVVVLLYCLLQAAFLLEPRRAAMGVLIFACLVEGLQALDYASWVVGDRQNWVSTLLGRTFSWSDLLAYLAGWGILQLDRAAVRRPVAS